MSKEKPDIRRDYLSGAETLRPFYRYPWPPGDYSEVIRNKSKDATPRDLLADVLEAQNRGLPDAGAMLANIAALRSPGTYTVTTGHQLCLLGGPMYTLYKIVTAIRLAEEIGRRQPEHRIVPVFWMATEDHDSDEIDHFHTDFGEQHSYQGEFTGPVGRHVLAASIREVFPEGTPAELAAEFRPGRKYAEAFRAFIHRLFGKFGLVIVDGDDPDLKSAFLPWMRAEFTGGGMAEEIRKTNEKLDAAGYKQQLHPRGINLFYIGGKARELIRETEAGFALRDGTKAWTHSEIEDELDAHPEHFSPNVAMRPLYQEALLPNLAYIGGWAEISYWMQLRAAFDAAEVQFPILVPRMSATLVTGPQARELEALGFAPHEIAEPLHVLNDRYLLRQWDPAPVESAIARLLEDFHGLAAELDPLDPTLATQVRAEQARTGKTMDKLQKKLRKSLRNQDPQPYVMLRELKAAIQPEHKEQQRILNFTAFTHIPYRDLIDLIFERCEPENYQEQWILAP